jgi:NADH-quinone oxidoreductase subunit H
MIENADQIFVLLQHWVMSFFPPALQHVVGVLISVVAIICVFPALFAISVLLERKGLGRMQNRYGPNRVGPLGILQPVADGLKSLTKEDIVPTSADGVVHFLAPVFLVVVVFMGYAVLPMGRNMTLVNLDAGLLFFFAMGASTELSVFMAGWSSRNKYSLLGAMRAVAQMISYEVPLLLASLVVVMMTGSMNLGRIVDVQNQYTWGLPHWYIFTPWGFAAFLLYATATTAESNRSPFDLPEGESELVAGYFTEYSGFKFALFFLGEYVGMLSVSGLGATLFSRRLVGAVLIPDMGAVVDLVLRQGHAFHLRVYLAARHAAPPAPGPADELCVEVCAASFASELVCRRAVEISWRRIRTLGRVFGDFAGCLLCYGQGGHAQGKLWAKELPVCGVRIAGAGHDDRLLFDRCDYCRRGTGGGTVEEHGALRAGVDGGVCRVGGSVS